MIRRTLLITQQTFRRLDAPEVAEGVTYVNGCEAEFGHGREEGRRLSSFTHLLTRHPGPPGLTQATTDLLGHVVMR
jgi:hypothetical protein